MGYELYENPNGFYLDDGKDAVVLNSKILNVNIFLGL